MIRTVPEVFEQAIREEPDEPVHRLAYADWLQDIDDPVQSARGEFIRLQCDLERMAPNDPHRVETLARERALREQFGWLWAGPVRSLVRGFEFRRGFVERIRLDATDFLQHAEELFQLAPIVDVELSARAANLHALALSPHLSRVTSLEVDCSGAPSSLLLRFFGARVHGLRHLRLRALPADYLATLTGNHSLVCLEALDLGFNPLGTGGVEILADSIRLPALRTLLLNHCQLGTAGVELLAGTPLMEQLSALDLRRNDVTSAGAAALARAPNCRRLEVLRLGFNAILDAGVAALAGSERLPALERLYTCDNTLNGPGVEALARSPLLGRLTHLDFDYNALTAASLEALARAPRLHSIQTLYLRCGRGLTARVRRLLRRRLGEGVCRF